MLKIKDNVDLNKLKELGFRGEDNYYRYNNEEGTIYYVFRKSRKISCTVDKYPNTYKTFDKIFELINEGIVEEFDEEEGE